MNWGSKTSATCTIARGRGVWAEAMIQPHQAFDYSRSFTQVGITHVGLLDPMIILILIF